MALTGSLHSNTCYLSASDARDAYFSSLNPFVTAGVPGYFTDFALVAGVWKMRTYEIDGAGNKLFLYSTQAVYPAFPVCDPLTGFNDGLYVGGMLLLAVISAVIFGIISKAK